MELEHILTASKNCSTHRQSYSSDDAISTINNTAFKSPMWEAEYR